MKVNQLLRAATMFEKLAQVQLHPAWNPVTKDYYTNSGKAGDVSHTYQDYETPKLTPLDYEDQLDPESPFPDAPGASDGSYMDWKPQYYQNIDPTHRLAPTTQQVKYQPGQQPPASKPEPLPNFLLRTYNTLKANQPLAPADANIWKQYQPTLKARWEQLKNLPTPTLQQQQERDILGLVFQKMSPGISV